MSEEEISSSDVYLQPKLLFEKGKKYLIRASSGRGKTSLLNFIYGNNTHFDGKINYLTSLKHSSPFDFRERKMSYVFQDLKLFSELSLVENIQLKNILTKYKTTEEIDEWIDRVGLSHKKDAPAKTLSLGQRQRVAILRALCQPFDFFLMDEPFSHLDAKNVGIVVSIILEELESQQAGLIITSLGEEKFFNYDYQLNL